MVTLDGVSVKVVFLLFLFVPVCKNYFSFLYFVYVKTLEIARIAPNEMKGVTFNRFAVITLRNGNWPLVFFYFFSPLHLHLFYPRRCTTGARDWWESMAREPWTFSLTTRIRSSFSPYWCACVLNVDSRCQ